MLFMHRSRRASGSSGRRRGDVGFLREEKAYMNPSAAVWTPAAAAAGLAVESDGSEQGAAVARICSQVLQGLDDDTL